MIARTTISAPTAETPFATQRPSRAPRRAGLFLLALAIALFPACEGSFAKYSTSARVKQLHTAVADFNKFIRWQEWERASDFVTEEDQAEFKNKFQEIEEEFRITDFEIRDTDVEEPESKFAETIVLYHYYLLPSVTEKKVRATQNWVWSETEKKWEVKSPLDFLKLVERPDKNQPGARAARLAVADSDR
ncbi:MAG: hypothetical protein Q8R92_10495 [Deltaproteobacteria bacterium]|nr:hypothetical protein [Deltaproteobacteria bacterium]